MASLVSAEFCIAVGSPPQTPTHALAASRRNRAISNHITLWFCLSFLLVGLNVAAQQKDQFQPQNVVVKIHKINIGLPVKFKYGTGWCLDPACGLIISNYHLAMYMGLPLSVGGQKVLDQKLATGPNDVGAILMNWRESSIMPLKYVPSEDMAIFRLERPLASTHRGMHGIALSSKQLHSGEAITVYSFSGGKKLVTFAGTFQREFSDGVLEFATQPSEDKKVPSPGVSGGLVVNGHNEAVGLVYGMEKGNDRLVVAVPIWKLADFVSRAQPQLYSTLFPQEPYRPEFARPISADTDSEFGYLDRAFAPSEIGVNAKSILSESFLDYEIDKPVTPFMVRRSDANQHRIEEPANIQLLRTNAQKIADDMKNFIAIETLYFGGPRTAETLARDEIQVIDGHQQFREWPNGKKQLSDSLLPTKGLTIGDAWSTLAYMIGNDLKLRIEQLADRQIDGRKIQIFHYEASVEEGACRFESVTDYGFWKYTWLRAVSCSGEVWADEQFNILRITEDDDLPVRKAVWQNVHKIVIYGFLEEPTKEVKIVPTMVLLKGDFAAGETFWCRGNFSDYRMFSSDVKIGSETKLDPVDVISTNSSSVEESR